jgi:2,3-bisphosphoglycerate-dependent phosphoglycerate mutase
MKQAADAVPGILEMAARENLTVYPVIDSSLQLRGWQTATIIANELEKLGIRDVSVESNENLAERCLGSAANLTVEQIEKIVADDPRYQHLPTGWKSDSNFRIPLQGAESLMQAGERVKQHVTTRSDHLAATTATDTLKIFVGHGAAFRHAAVHMGLLTASEAVALSMFHCHPVYFERLQGPQHNDWQHIGGEWKKRKAKDLNLD